MEDVMRSARVLAVAAVIFATACGISKGTPIAPLTGVQTDSSNITQAWYGYHRHYYHRHYYGYYRPYYGLYGYYQPYGYYHWHRWWW